MYEYGALYVCVCMYAYGPLCMQCASYMRIVVVALVYHYMFVSMNDACAWNEFGQSVIPSVARTRETPPLWCQCEFVIRVPTVDGVIVF